MREPKTENHVPLTREQVLKLISDERDYQEKTWDATEVLPSGLTRGQRNLELPPFLVMLNSYIRDANDSWTWDYKRGTDEVTVLQQLVKIGAIAAAALEHSGFGQELLKRGIR